LLADVCLLPTIFLDSENSSSDDDTEEITNYIERQLVEKNKPTRIESFEILVRYLCPRFEKFEGSVGTVVFKKVLYCGDQKILAVTILTFTKCK
jgi:hypothetical protein